MKSTVKIILWFLALFIVVLLFGLGKMMWLEYKIAYKKGVLHGMCDVSKRLGIDSKGACEGHIDDSTDKAFLDGYDNGYSDARKDLESQYPPFVKMEDGWRCDKQGGIVELLRPTGIWTNQHFSCWKNTQSRDEYCAENLDYCQPNK